MTSEPLTAGRPETLVESSGLLDVLTEDGVRRLCDLFDMSRHTAVRFIDAVEHPQPAALRPSIRIDGQPSKTVG